MWVTAAPVLPDTSDLGLKLTAFVRETPQWQVFRGCCADWEVTAWRYLPFHLRPGPVLHGLHVWDQMRRRLDADRRDGWQRWVAVEWSSKSDSGWVIHQSSCKPLSPMPGRTSEIANLTSKLLEELQRIHRENRLHLDIHPDTVIFEDGIFMLAGVACDIRQDAGRWQGSNIGIARRGYSPPEMWDASARGSLGFWTDIYSAAATLFYVVTGQHPADFRDRPADAKWRQEVKRKVDGRLEGSDVRAAAISQLIIRGLEPAIERRPRSVEEWIRSLPVPLARRPA